MTEFPRFTSRRSTPSTTARHRFTRAFGLWPVMMLSGCALLPLDPPPEGATNAALGPDAGTSSSGADSLSTQGGPNVGTINPPDNGSHPNPNETSGTRPPTTSATDGSDSDTLPDIPSNTAAATSANVTDDSTPGSGGNTEQNGTTGEATDPDETTDPSNVTDPDETDVFTHASTTDGTATDPNPTTTNPATDDPETEDPDVTVNPPDTTDNGETSTDDGPGPGCPAGLNPCGPSECSAWVAACVSDADYTRSTSPSENACNFDCDETPRECSLEADSYCPAACRHTDDADCVRPNRFFVTRSAYDGNLGGLTGADQKCQASADAAGLDGTFVAVIGTSTTTARSRLGSARGFIRVDDAPFADLSTQLISGVVFNPPDINEYGERMPTSTTVATGFQRTGQAAYVCNDWTANQGSSGDVAYAGYTGGTWRYLGLGGCTGRFHLYCSETSKQAVVKPVAVAGTRKAFLAPGYDRTSGLAGADARCNAAAQSANLPGTFKALLGAVGQPASKRFDLTGAPWARVDGTKIVDKASDLADGNLVSSLSQTADGQYVLDGYAWTGMSEISGKPLESCGDWSATAAPRVGHTGNIASAGSTFLSHDWDNLHRCSKDDGYLYCLEETSTGVQPPALPDARANVMFVTSETYDGNLGGLSGADQKCNASAASAGLSGTFVALLSSPAINAFDRLGDARGFVRPDGKPIAGSPIELREGRFAYPPNLDADGAQQSDWVWTGRTADCSGWTSNADDPPAPPYGGDAGDASLSGDAAFGYGSVGCSAKLHLYCTEVSQRAALPAANVSGYRLAFVARGSLENYSDYIIDPGVGLAGLDSQCQTEASIAGLSGTYKALVATTSASPASRFNSSGAPYARPDGVKLSDTGAQFFAEGPKYPINVSADGFEYFSNNGVWFGATSLTSVGTDTCNNWTSRTGDYSGLRTLAGDASFTSYNYTTCDARYLYVTCLQQ